ncbi:MAG: type I polyketide synthase, partial [Phototrophicaceae bacterium]
LKDALLEIRQLRGDLETLENAQREPLAIIGVSGRYPGSPNVDAYWEMLRSGGNPVAEIPQARWDMGQFYDPEMKRPSGAISSNLACLLDEIDRFDAPFFGISPREAKRLDPQQRMMLEVTWEALEHAGYDPAKLNGSNTAIYIGAGNSDYNVMQMYPRSAIDAYVGTGSSRSLLANRLSYILNFHGASMSIDTACSSSLVAIDLAARALRNRETDLAVAGGVSLILSPDLSITFSHANMLAPDGRCKTFDASADGYVRGEGVGAIILKRLSDAQRDNDTILALVRGTAVNQDGRSNGLTAPNGVAQELVIKAALLNAGLTAADIHYVEAHGTGTSLGDPIEMSALGNVYGRAHSKDNPFYAASVKTNIGHLEGAAGVAGVTKVLLAMQHRAIPPHLHFTNPSPYINWKKIPVVIPTELTPIPDDLVFRAGVSSFGFGGTNSHVILESAPVDQRPSQPQRPQIVVKLAARTDAALNQMAAGYAAALDQSPAALADLAYTANAGRSDHPLRAAVVGASREELRDKLLQLAMGSTPAGTVRGEAEAPAEVVF